MLSSTITLQDQEQTNYAFWILNLSVNHRFIRLFFGPMCLQKYVAYYDNLHQHLYLSKILKFILFLTYKTPPYIFIVKPIRWIRLSVEEFSLVTIFIYNRPSLRKGPSLASQWPNTSQVFRHPFSFKERNGFKIPVILSTRVLTKINSNEKFHNN